MDPKAVILETLANLPRRSARKASPNFAGSTLLAAQPEINAQGNFVNGNRGFECRQKKSPSSDSKGEFNPVKNERNENPCIRNTFEFVFDFSPAYVLCAEIQERSTYREAEKEP